MDQGDIDRTAHPMKQLHRFIHVIHVPGLYRGYAVVRDNFPGLLVGQVVTAAAQDFTDHFLGCCAVHVQLSKRLRGFLQ